MQISSSQIQKKFVSRINVENPSLRIKQKNNQVLLDGFIKGKPIIKKDGNNEEYADGILREIIDILGQDLINTYIDILDGDKLLLIF